MSRVTIKEWYGRVNSSWPETVPPLDKKEAVRAARKLWRFVTGEKCPHPVKLTSGKRYTQVRYGTEPGSGRSLFVNWTGHHRGAWHDLIHDLSHSLHRRVNVGDRPHEQTHARLELRMRLEVLKRGWLNGTLKEAPPTLRLVTPESERDKRIAKRRAQVARLERKIKALSTRLKRAKRSLSALERSKSKASAVPVESPGVTE